MLTKRGRLEILPCTVSQLLTASTVSNDSFAIRDWELNQVSVVGVVRGYAPFSTNVQYSVDDMTGPPLNVQQWVNAEVCTPMTFASPPGKYVKVIGSLRNYEGQRSLLAMTIRHIKDLNEITSHMLEVVQAHMQRFGKMFDVNMNTTASPLPGRALSRPDGHSEGILPHGLSSMQGEVLQVIRRFSVRADGIGFDNLKTELGYLSMKDIRTSLTFLTNKGHVFSTIDDNHFKSTEH
ncbi:replication protein A 32 kDa subunit-like isoform X2 [Scomber scombrus]|uniref:Replication protein A 32 kDa subunit-like isoform X2 n=1 Tax=Scomber scombrus TaxID=13677 RepID=A0AAV1PTC1_SCOSC